MKTVNKYHSGLLCAKTAIKTTCMAASIFLSSACCRHVAAPQIIERKIIRDSVIERIRDTLVKAPPDSSWLRALLECDSVGNVRLKELLDYKAGQRSAPPTVRINNNVLTALSLSDSLNIYVKMKERHRWTVEDNIKTVTETIEVNKITSMQNFWIILGKIFASISFALMGFGAWKILGK
jgi:hypothetical protein